MDLPKLPPFPAEALAAVDLLVGDNGVIRNILAAYDRTNAMAHIALLSRLEGVGPATDVVVSRAVEKTSELPSSIPLPTLPTIEELPPATAR